MNLLIDMTNIAPGGGLIVLGNILRQWRQLEVDLKITAIVSRKATAAGLQEFRDDIKILPFMPDASPAAVFLGRRFLLGKKIENLNPDLVMAIASMVGNCSVPQHVHHQNLRWLMDWPFVQTLRTQGLKQTLRCRRQHAESLSTLRNSRCNTFISDYMRQVACRIVPESAPRNFTIRNASGVPVKQDNFNPSPKPIVAAIQNSDYYKDSTTLIRMFAKCVNLRPDIDWELKIAGGGNWKSAINLAGRLGVSDRISFLGYSDSSRILSLLDEALCLVFPSRCEGFGIPPLEAMARGCAVVSSNADALSEVVGEGGILIQPGDVDGFAAEVIELWDNPSTRLSLVESGYSQVEKFSWARSAARLAELLMKGQIV